jgi:hypothetical protein
LLEVSVSFNTGVPQILPSQFRCANHPDREGVGVCVGCRSVICVECSTKIDRMNYCTRCLNAASPEAKARKAATPLQAAALGIPLLVLSFAVTVLVFVGMGYLIAAARAAMSGGVTAG